METRGEVLIRSLWENKTEAIINVILEDQDLYTHKKEPMGMLLAWWEKLNKYKHGNHYHEQRTNFLCLLSPLTERLEIIP